MKKIFLISLLFIVTNVFAATEKLIGCPTNTNELSKLFEQNWEQLAKFPYNFSYVAKTCGQAEFIGALHSETATKPVDLNPHLQQPHVYLTEVSHYSVWHIDCRYPINNKQITDLGDGYLHFVTSVPNSYHCKKVGTIRIKCIEN